MSRPDEDDDCYLPIDGIEFFRQLNGRQFNTMNHTYLLPSDDEEIKVRILDGWHYAGIHPPQRYDLLHRVIQFIFLGRIYVGPVKSVLQFGPYRKGEPGRHCDPSLLNLYLSARFGDRRLLSADGGFINFLQVFVTGVDIVPIQHREVPERCRFEIWDINTPDMPYEDAYFDLIHARAIHTGIRDYPRFLRQIARILRPGGLVILIEPDLVQYVWCLPPTYSLEVN
ncbi:S-adenosyl-L-methionine-dependent methyltransferase [Mycena venus]|uniref:S-adenosyl-L-methionine-dependent methyltransferase n=1 Tax=Mycena venus TaxID=2733690 RepID=A0A8H7CFP1_9AGAR|nr:S-adenosyl-L-methionine-dependent methyltransferase [Mycena venus]